jgi:hypothetical protein
MSIHDLYVAIAFGQILQGGIENDRIEPDMPKRIVLCSWRLLNQVVSLAIPEYNVGSSPTNDEIPKAGSQWGFHIVVQDPVAPMVVRLTGGIRIDGGTSQKDIPTCF